MFKLDFDKKKLIVNSSKKYKYSQGEGFPNVKTALKLTIEGLVNKRAFKL